MRALVALLLAATPAIANASVCAPLEDLARVLKDDHQEVPIAIGDARGGQVIVFSTRDGSSWTILLVGQSGHACVAADGVRWRLPGRGA
ncbi:MAG: hypothetical protein ACK52I_19530 [Pseudomonadota bacterium]|jgi:hypothetical protein